MEYRPVVGRDFVAEVCKLLLGNSLHKHCHIQIFLVNIHRVLDLPDLEVVDAL